MHRQYRQLCKECAYYRHCNLVCGNFKQKTNILDKMFELLKDGETHTYKEIAEKVWECELDKNLMRNIRTQKSRLRKKYNLNFKTLHNRGIRLTSERNSVDE